MNTHSRLDQKEADLDRQRKSAVERRDGHAYYLLCNRQGIEPELPELYEQGQIIAQHIPPKISGLEAVIETNQLSNKSKTTTQQEPLTENEISFLREYEMHRYSDEYTLRLHFKKFKLGEVQDLSKYKKRQIHKIAESMYKTYKKKEK